ncbi:MAG: carboxypeptidase-like regulatory domain-containing protein [Deltaproteobacteria bacterium]
MTRFFLAFVRTRACALCAFACLAASGCGGQAEVPELVPVTGKVTFGGQPLADALVVFMPADPSEEEGMTDIVRPTARTDADGSYELAWNDNTGAPPGKYNIIIMAFKPRGETDDTEERPASLIPEKYGDPKASGLAREVKDAGDNVINFDLQ